LINAIKKEYKVKKLDEIRKIAEKWAPYKTIATLYLWESLGDDFPN
jgi:DNA-3-methyladenine glycosylase II